MYTMTTLGTFGQLENQMFQYAFLKNISAKHGHDFCIPKGSDLAAIFHVANEVDIDNVSVDIKWDNFRLGYLEIPKFDLSDTVDFQGYFQSYKHLGQHTWYPKTPHNTPNLDINDTAVVFVRLKDYVGSSFNRIAPRAYYHYCIQRSKCSQVLLVSDDPEQARTLLPVTTKCHLLKPVGFQQMIDASKYRKFILACSTFGWWSAWISGSTDVYYPSPWTLKGDVKDLCPPEWTRIEA